MKSKNNNLNVNASFSIYYFIGLKKRQSITYLARIYNSFNLHIYEIIWIRNIKLSKVFFIWHDFYLLWYYGFKYSNCDAIYGSIDYGIM